MKRQIYYILLLIFSMTFFPSCQILTQTEKYENEGEAEKVRIKEYFRENYEPQIHTKYNGTVDLKTVNLIDYVDYENISVRLDIQNESFKNIFVSGLISGQMLNKMNSDSVSVCCFEELTYVRTQRNQRRFKFLVFYDNFMNPSVFLIEFTNNQSDRKSDIETFLNGAELTFIVSPWIQI